MHLTFTPIKFNLFEHASYLHADVPRIYCKEHKEIENVLLPWARKNSGFTLLFEILSIELAREMPMVQVGKLTGESGPVIYRIIEGCVDKASEREDFSNVTNIGFDETRTKKRS